MLKRYIDTSYQLLSVYGKKNDYDWLSNYTTNKKKNNNSFWKNVLNLILIFDSFVSCSLDSIILWYMPPENDLLFYVRGALHQTALCSIHIVPMHV